MTRPTLIDAKARFGALDTTTGSPLGKPGSRHLDSTLALVLAGGRGSRLHGLTDDRAKPAVPFGGKYRLIDFALSNCINSGVGRVGILTQYKSHSLNQHVQQAWGMGANDGTPMMQLLPAQQRTNENDWYAGTADAIYQNLDIIRGYDAEHVLILAGDHIYKMDYAPLIDAHIESGADMSISATQTSVDDARSFGVLGIDQSGQVQRFTEKPSNPETIPGNPDACLSSMGVYVFKAEFLYNVLCANHLTNSGNDFGRDIIPALIKNHKVMSYAFTDPNGDASYWRDVGTIDAFWQANMELIGATPALDLYDRSWPIRTLPNQAPPAKFVYDSAEICGAAVNTLLCEGCVISGALIKNSVLCTNVIAEEQTHMVDCVVLPDCTIGKHCSLRRVVLDRSCVVPDGTVIGYDKDLDAARFQVTDSNIVLVTQLMLDALDSTDQRSVA